MSTEPVTFYDSARPDLIPAGATHAALYYDGLYGPAGRAQEIRFARRRWITVFGDPWHCGIADFEPGNPVYANSVLLWDWARARKEAGHPYRIYCDRAEAARAWGVLGFYAEDALWWIATLDGRDWTPEDLAADLDQSWGAPIPAGRIWGNQNRGGPLADWDSSRLFREW